MSQLSCLTCVGSVFVPHAAPGVDGWYLRDLVKARSLHFGLHSWLRSLSAQFLYIKDFRNIKALHAAVSSVNNSKLSVVDPGKGEWGYRTRRIDEENDLEAQSVATVSIESLMNEPESSPFILKIDVEGTEDDIFSENTDRFNEIPLIIIELHDWILPRAVNSRKFLQWHAEQGRDFITGGEFFRLAIHLFP